ncbi:hypothetical protein AcW1_000935 [Taiwanofungus camphoratus]|nr:hypothetical protein AcW1_000935 [Antrodia cinnamomea]
MMACLALTPLESILPRHGILMINLHVLKSHYPRGSGPWHGFFVPDCPAPVRSCTLAKMPYRASPHSAPYTQTFARTRRDWVTAMGAQLPNVMLARKEVAWEPAAAVKPARRRISIILGS